MKRTLFLMLALVSLLPAMVSAQEAEKTLDPVRIEVTTLAGVQAEYALPLGPVTLAPRAAVTYQDIQGGPTAVISGGVVLYPLSDKGLGLFVGAGYDYTKTGPSGATRNVHRAAAELGYRIPTLWKIVTGTLFVRETYEFNIPEVSTVSPWQMDLGLTVGVAF